MNRKTLIVSALAAAVAPIAGAAVINSAVATSLLLANNGGSFTASGNSSKQSGIGDKGTLIGTFGANSDIYTCYQVQLLGTGTGAHGGNEYSVSVVVGSAKKQGPFAQFYKSAIALSTDTIAGAALKTATVSFGAGGGGLSFDDFGAGSTALAIDAAQGGGTSTQRADPLQYADANPTQYGNVGTINADGTLGFVAAFNVNSLWQQGSDVSSYFGGNLAAFDIYGYSTSMFVETYAPAPAPGAIALVGLAGLASRRRRA